MHLQVTYLDNFIRLDNNFRFGHFDFKLTDSIILRVNNLCIFHLAVTLFIGIFT